MKFKNLKSSKVFLFSGLFLTFGVLVFVVSKITHSSLFTLRVTEISGILKTDQEDVKGAPVSERDVLELAQIPLSGVNLLTFDPEPARKRILEHPWIKNVRLVKKLPQTLLILVELRKPELLFVEAQGKKYYLDSDLVFIGPIHTSIEDLPVVSSSRSYSVNAKGGIDLKKEDPLYGQLKTALQIMKVWNSKYLNTAVIDAIEVDSPRGIEVILSLSEVMSVPVILGNAEERDFKKDEGDKEGNEELELQFEQVQKVLSTLGTKNIKPLLIMANLGKKIVVKIPSGT